MGKYKGKKVLVVGFGISGVAVARYMTKQGAKVTVTDMKQRNELLESVNASADLKLDYEFGKHNSKTFLSVDLIVLSPGVPTNIPPLQEAREKGIQITSEVDLAAAGLDVPLIAITGTNGKTTVTTMIGEMFRADKRSVFVGGNIGKPLIQHLITDDHADYVVAELSSFQLETMQKITPAAAVFTNIEEDHLERHGSFENYIEMKKRMIRACDKNSFVVLNYDCPVVSQFAGENIGKMMWFTRRNPAQISPEFAQKFWGAYFDQPNNRIVTRLTGQEEAYDLSQFKLLGDHNRENLMAALCAARSMGVSPAAIQQVIQEFRGVSHRLEFVRKKDGVFFFNDSKATNVMSVKRSLASFKHSPIILIAGGRDKGSEYGPLADLIREKCKIMILLGEAKEKINRALGDYTETYLVGTFEEAILLAFQKSRRGDIILLSPACSSYDMFRNFEERGDYFKKLVSQL